MSSTRMEPHHLWRFALQDYARLFMRTDNSTEREFTIGDMFLGIPLSSSTIESKLFPMFKGYAFAWVNKTTAIQLEQLRDNDIEKTTHVFSLSYAIMKHYQPRKSVNDASKLAYRMLVECQPLTFHTEKKVYPYCSDWLHVWQPPMKVLNESSGTESHKHRFGLMSVMNINSACRLSFLDVLGEYGNPVSVSALVATCNKYSGDSVDNRFLPTEVSFIYKDYMVESNTNKRLKAAEGLEVVNQTTDSECYNLLSAMHKVVSYIKDGLAEPLLVEVCLMCQTIYFHALIGNLDQWNDIRRGADIRKLYYEIKSNEMYSLEVDKEGLSDDDVACLVELDFVLRSRFHAYVHELETLTGGYTTLYKTDVKQMPIMPFRLVPPTAATKRLRRG